MATENKWIPKNKKAQSETRIFRETPRVLLGNELGKIPVRKAGVEYVTKFDSADGMDSFYLTEEQYAMHTMLLGGIGSGKTNVFRNIVRTLRECMKKDDVMIIFDSKGDFYKDFFRSGDVVIGNDKKYRNDSWQWNIYGEVAGRLFQPTEYFEYDKEWELNAKEIMKALFKSRRSSTQPFFADAAADLIAAKICSVLRSGDVRQLHTTELKNFFRRATVREYDEFVLNSCDGDYRYAKQYYGEGDTPQALAVFAYINSMVSDCLVGIFGDNDVSAGKEFAMRDLVRKKGAKVVFVEYDLKLGEMLGPIYQMLYDQALKEALGQSENEKGNVYLICDEFKLLGNLSHIDDGLNFGRSLGVKICAGLQSVNQIYDIYGETKGKVILAGFSNMFCFQSGDAETRKYISEHFGKNFTDVSTWQESANKVHLQRESYVVETWDIQKLERGEAVIQVWEPIPQPPFVFRFKKYEIEKRAN